MPRALLITLVVMLGVAWSRPARATEPLGLVVASRADFPAQQCGDTERLRARIAERLGRDPFGGEAEAAGRIRVLFAHEKLSWTAEIVVFDAAGARAGVRTLAREGGNCEPLVASVVLTIALLLEELAPQAPAAPSPVEREPPAKDGPPPEPLPRPTPVDVDASLGGAGAVGGAPAPSVGVDAVVGLDVKRFRVELAGRTFWPASGGGDVAVRTRLFYGRVAPCYGWPVLSACVVAAVGSVSGEATGEGVASSHLDSRVYAAAGVGGLARLFVVGERVFVRATVDLLLAVSRVGFDVGDRRVWTLPPLSVVAALGVGVRLP